MKTRQTLLALTALLIGGLSAPALAQQAPASGSLDDVFLRLEQLQDANLGVARQMAQLQRQAAAELEAAVNGGAVENGAHQAVAKTFIGNARTLASVLLSPMQTYQTAAGESMLVLVRRNIEMLESLATVSGQDPDFDAAITRYTVLQMQTEDMAMALQNGWNRYADILKAAESSGLLASNMFDPDTQSWSLGTPPPAPVAVASLPQPVAPAVVVPQSEPPQATTTAAPEPQPPVAEERLPATPAEPVPEPAAEPAAEPVPEPEPVLEPVPQLTGTPRPSTQTAEVPLASAVTPLEPPALVDSVETAATAERLTPGGPLDVSGAPAPVAMASTQIGDWAISTDRTGLAWASSPNLVFETTTVIQSLMIECAPDGTVQYIVNAARDFPAFRVYSDRSQHRTVTAEQNVVRGGEAVAMAETLQLAYQWAQQVPDAGRRLTVRTADTDGVLALFATSGYPEARTQVLDSCAARQTVAATGPIDIMPPSEEVPSEALVEERAPAEEDPASETAVTPAPPTVAPIPAPRLERPAHAVQPPPADSGPIDLLGGG